jgi:hypothetical protein
MRKAGKIGLGFAAFAPLLLGVTYLVTIFLFTATRPKGAPPSKFFFCLPLLFGFGAFGSSVGVGALFAVRAWRSERVADDVKLAWAIILVILGIYAAPVFWWIHVLRPPRLRVAPPPLSRRARIALGVISLAPLACIAGFVLVFAAVFLLMPGAGPSASAATVAATPDASPAEASPSAAEQSSPAPVAGAGRSGAPDDRSPSVADIVGIVSTFAFLVCCMAASYVAVILYLVRVFRADHLNKNEKVMWVLLLLFVWPLAPPIYWHLYLRAPARPQPPRADLPAEAMQQ